MAQTKRKRQTKHRGNAVGVIESRGRTGRKPTPGEKSGDPAKLAREREAKLDKRDQPPTWRNAFIKAMIAAIALVVVFVLLLHQSSGAVAPLARATGAPVYCPQIEQPVLADVMSWVPPGFGPFESYQAEHTLAGGEKLQLAGLDIEVVFTPGHSPGHLTYVVQSPTHPALLSGDVLFQGSVGRVDLPGGDWGTLERSIEGLIRAYPPEAVVYPGHMGVTTLGRELTSNPFLAEIRGRIAHAGSVAQPAPAS